MENVNVLNGVRQLIDTHIGWMDEDDLFWHRLELEHVRTHLKLLIEDAERAIEVYTQADGASVRARVPDLNNWLAEARNLAGILDRVLSADAQ